MYGLLNRSSSSCSVDTCKWQSVVARPSGSHVLFPPLQAVVNLLTLREVAQLGDVVKHGLQIIVTDLTLERGDQCASLFRCVAAERAC